LFQIMAEPIHDIRELDWFVDWHPWLWSSAVRSVLGDPSRFKNKRVLELGFRTGRMSCYFGLLGAVVHGVDVPPCEIESAIQLSEELGVADRVNFRLYDGNLHSLEMGNWDFVFTKSVLVLLPIDEAAPAIRRLLAPGGEYLGCENLALPLGLNKLRRWYQIGVNKRTLAVMRQHFSRVTVRNRFGLIASIVAAV
jgi:hypothetical protein